MKIITIAFLILFICPAFATDGGVLITRGFVTAEVYVAANQAERRAYVKGIVDGILISPLMDARVEKATITLSRCLSGVTSDQLDKLILVELAASGRSPSQSVHIVAFKVIVQLCSEQGGGQHRNAR